MIARLGPHDLTGLATPEVRRWAEKAHAVKSVGNTAAIGVAHPGAIQVYRWPFSEVEQSNILDNQLAAQMANTILGGLAGYRAPNLYVEMLNEVGKGRRDQYVRLCKVAIPLLQSWGVRVAGPSWATGDYEADDWEAFAGLGLDAIALHAYWSTAGFTQWNALRWQEYWRPGNPRVLVTETGRDRVRDGNPNVNEGWLPLENSGSYGWQAASQQCSEDQYLEELVQYDALLQADPAVLGAVVFTSSPTDDWRDKGFSTDNIAGRMADLTALRADSEGSTPKPAPIGTPTPTAPPAPTTPPVKPSPVKVEWCPFAQRKPIERNFTPGRSGRAVQLIVDHIAEGDHSPFGWFNRDAGENGSSAHFWIAYDGAIEQYRPLSDTCWANGPKCKPDLSNPIVKELVESGMIGMNSVSVAIEHAGWSGEPLTAAQIASSRKLHAWLGPVVRVPLDRTSVIGHAQIDSCSRAGCPGPTFPWSEILGGGTVPDPKPVDEQLEENVLAPVFKAQEWLRINAKTERQRRWQGVLDFAFRDLKGEI